MLAPRRVVARFSLLLLEDGEDYVADWVASCTGWPIAVTGNWSGAPTLPGRLRLASKSLFFEADDVRVPIVRCEPVANLIYPNNSYNDIVKMIIITNNDR